MFRKSNSKSILLFLGCIILSCGSSVNHRYKLLGEILDSHQEFKKLQVDEKVLVIIPNAGCTGCITTAEAFVLDNVDKSDNVKFIFTGTSSLKALRLKLGEDIYENERVYIDGENLFYSPDLISIYPLVVYLQNGLVTTIEEMSPDKPNHFDKSRVNAYR